MDVTPYRRAAGTCRHPTAGGNRPLSTLHALLRIFEPLLQLGDLRREVQLQRLLLGFQGGDGLPQLFSV
jgi:hypothetical protein